MKDIVAEQLQDVATPLLVPLAVMLILRAFIEEIEFSEKTHKARVLELTGQVRVQLVIKIEGSFECGGDSDGNAGKESVDGSDLFRGTVIQKPRDALTEIRSKGTVKDLNSFCWVGCVEVVRCYDEDEAAELVKIQPLESMEWFCLVVLYDV